MKKLLAIGCGGAGMFSLVVASQLRKGKFETIVLSDEPDIYCRCTSTYILSGEAEIDDAIQPESMVSDYGVKIIHEKAVKIDTAKREVLTDQGTVFAYDELVIATGARPVRPPIPGIDLPGIYTVRTSDDARRMQETARTAESVVVIGAGVIGMEVAGALRVGQMKHITLVESATSIPRAIADPEFADRLVSLLKGNDIDVRFESRVVEIKLGADGKKEVVIERAGATESLVADMVIVATGVRPNSEIAEEAGIEVSPQGIVVDDRMRTSSAHVYACGDCAAPHSAVTGERVASTLASLAIQQSKIVGFQIAGFPIRYGGSTGAFALRILGREYASVGLTEELAREKFRWVAVGRAESTDVYNDLKSKQPLWVKLIFAGPRMRLVGYEAYGNGVIASAEVASFAIGQKTSILGMLRFNYISHPSLTPWPFMNPIIMATEDAMNHLMQRIRSFLGARSI